MRSIVVVSAFHMGMKLSSNNRTNFLPRFLLDKGYEVELCVPNFDHHTKSFVKVPNNAPYTIKYIKVTPYFKNVSILRIISQKVFAVKLFFHLLFRKNVDDFYVFIPSLEAGVSAVIASKIRRKKLIIDVRDLWPEVYYLIFGKNILSRILLFPQEIKANYIYRNADEIIAVSNTYKNRALKVNRKVKEGHTIYLGTSLKDFKNYNRNKKRFVSKEEVRLVYVGTLGHSYDLPTLFDAFKVLEQKYSGNITLSILGNGPLEHEMKEKASEVSDNIVFYGRLPYDDMIDVLLNSDIAINSLYKNAPQSIINKHADYAAAGLPVVNNQVCLEYNDILTDYSAGVNCENGNSLDMAEKILYLINNEDKAIQMGKNNRRFAEENFDRASSYDKLDFVLRGNKNENS